MTPLRKYWGTLSLIMMRGLSKYSAANSPCTGDYGDVVNYVRRKAALLPEEVLLDAD